MDCFQRRDAAPPGFDERRLEVARQALARKRCSQVASAWMPLAISLGPRFIELFLNYIESDRHWLRQAPLATGRYFAAVLAEKGLLTDAGRAQTLGFDLMRRLDRGTICVRRAPILRISFLPQSRALVVGWRVPPGRAHVWRVCRFSRTKGLFQRLKVREI